jgi:hypothetical protein
VSAETLKEISPHQFEWWAVDLVNARAAKDYKKGADTGIHGYTKFFADESEALPRRCCDVPLEIFSTS